MASSAPPATRRRQVSTLERRFRVALVMLVLGAVVALHGLCAYSLGLRGTLYFDVGIVLLLYALYCRDTLWQRQMIVYYNAAAMFSDYKWLQMQTKRRFGEDDSCPEALELWERAHRRNAKRAYATFVRLEGLWIKTGQYLSSRADVMPEVYSEELSKCQDEVPARDGRAVINVVERELGRPVPLLFEWFDPKPIACASIAQVHRAIVDGQDVVVKVQHENVEEAIRLDLLNLERIVRFVAWLEPDFDFRHIANEWTREVPNELDFIREKENMQRVEREAEDCRSAPSSSPLHMRVAFPQAVDRLCSRRVLTMSFIDGFKITDLGSLRRHGVDRDELVRNVARAFGNQIFRRGFFNGDPHPGNILVQVDARTGRATPVLLDFGLTKAITNDVRLAFSRMAVCASESDFAGLLNALESLGVQFSRQSDFLVTETMSLTRFFFRDSAPPDEMRSEFQNIMSKKMKTLDEEMAQDKSLRRNPLDAFPDSLVFFQKTIFLIRGIASGLHVKMAYLDLLSSFARAALMGEDGDMGMPPPFRLTAAVPSALSDRLLNCAAQLERQRMLLGCQVSVWLDGKCIADVAAGRVDIHTAAAVTPKTLFNVFSVSKSVMALALHRCVELGLLKYGDRVRKHWPAFRANCTVGQVLSHAAGLQNAGTKAIRKNLFVLTDWEKMLSHVAQAEAESPPGEKQVYHPLSFGFIVGGLIEHVSRRPLREFICRELSDPLGITPELRMGLGPIRRPRRGGGGAEVGWDESFEPSPTAVAQLYLDVKAERRRVALYAARRVVADSDLSSRLNELFDRETHRTRDSNALLNSPTIFNLNQVRRALIPAANGHFTAHGAAKLFAAVACGGRLPGASRTLREATVRAMAEGEPCRVGERAFGYGLVRYEITDTDSGGARRVAIGHSGVGGSIVFADPARRVAVAVTLNQLGLIPMSRAALLKCVFEYLQLGECDALLGNRLDEESAAGVQ